MANTVSLCVYLPLLPFWQAAVCKKSASKTTSMGKIVLQAFEIEKGPYVEVTFGVTADANLFTAEKKKATEQAIAEGIGIE